MTNNNEKVIDRIYELLEEAAEQQIIVKEFVYTNFEAELKKALKREIDEMSTLDVLLSLDNFKLASIFVELEDAVQDYKEFNKNELFVMPEFEF